MEPNLKTIKTLLKALHIAKESTQIAFSKNQLECRISGPSKTEEYLEKQTDLIDSLEEYEALIDQFQELETRQRNELLD